MTFVLETPPQTLFRFPGKGSSTPVAKRPAPNFGPLPLIVNNVTIPTNADQATYLANLSARASKDPPSTMYTMVINGSTLKLSQAQFLDVI